MESDEKIEKHFTHPFIAKNPVVPIKRSQISLATYNPRRMDERERQKLERGLQKFGLCETLCWNIRTGNLVGGHQRIQALDKKAKGKDYTIHVTQVDLDEKSERELNVLLNNPNAQGEWDLEKLETLIKIDKIEIENAGFDNADIHQLFGANPAIDTPEVLERLSDQLRAADEKIRAVIASEDSPQMDMD